MIHVSTALCEKFRYITFIILYYKRKVNIKCKISIHFIQLPLRSEKHYCP
ncbi:hypothetical protein HMPREF0080_00891 [Anaeroglobus geminatus F0357]|uniref:Uncharacterized protein n=1 Tax=Anaeroglobus geminatus F0357 TaxID=861450 RepID=G9YGX2_9FIRM|nr:hypothetical protein HMPREF0080_00891 [Anaeroglobus geminatus F0357]